MDPLYSRFFEAVFVVFPEIQTGAYTTLCLILFINLVVVLIFGLKLLKLEKLKNHVINYSQFFIKSLGVAIVACFGVFVWHISIPLAKNFDAVSHAYQYGWSQKHKLVIIAPENPELSSVAINVKEVCVITTGKDWSTRHMNYELVLLHEMTHCIDDKLAGDDFAYDGAEDVADLGSIVAYSLFHPQHEVNTVIDKLKTHRLIEAHTGFRDTLEASAKVFNKAMADHSPLRYPDGYYAMDRVIKTEPVKSKSKKGFHLGGSSYNKAEDMDKFILYSQKLTALNMGMLEVKQPRWASDHYSVDSINALLKADPFLENSRNTLSSKVKGKTEDAPIIAYLKKFVKV